MPLLAALALSGSLMFADHAEIGGEIVRLSDVADVAALPEAIRAKAAALQLARFDRNSREARVSAEALAARARSQMPALTFWLERGTGKYVTLHHPQVRARPLALAAGTRGIAHGDRVTVRIDVGPFRIEREALALADAKPGEALFVRVGDRQVIDALCEGAE